MIIHFELPAKIEEQARTSGVDLNRQAKEVYLIDLFRRGVIGHHELGQALELDRFETNALLMRHRVDERTLSDEEVDADVTGINALLTPPSP
ncbi:UPF0175 family protein [Tundrisphaera sp. TA3]|uniref:UPF0175 family protein n=1 Tax=Tundrisphaera sp. TA3 TaxID=3435775 RepID=UPI003EB9BF89